MTTENPLPTSDQGASSSDTIARRFGRYWLLKLIARGGMGEVYLAATTGIEGAERPCVVKIIRREHAKDSSFLARFFDEARVQSQLQHPGVVQIFEAATDENGEPYVVVEYVEGRSLGEIRTRALQLNYRLTWADAVAVAMATAEALVHVHERVDIRGKPLDIVHRDLSPQNVMVGYCGDVKLIDFGTARGQNRRCHTVSGVVFAKPGYVAPEVANGNTGDARVDLYALGVMLWELAAGRRFLQGDATEHLASVAKNQRPLTPIAQLVGAPAQLDEVIAKLTAHALDARYASARAALKDLVALLSKAPSMTNGERGVRTRIAQFMSTIYPSEPTRSRREFARLVSVARARMQQAEQEEAAGREEPQEEEEDESILPGTRYRLVRKIGEGAVGAVYEAEHVDLGRRVALKLVSGERTISSDFGVRFRREARALSRLSHPNLVALHDFGQASDGRLFCTMDLLEGETLDHTIAREAPVRWDRALSLGAQVARALEVAHEAGLVHRDLKPSNLFLCADGTVKLLDFGLAETGEESGEKSDERSGFTLFGTPEYMAPEQISGDKVDARADMYSLGCVLYELCTGKLPYSGENSVRILDAKLTRDAESPRRSDVCAEMPTEVERLIVHAMARKPSDRIESARAMRAQIESALQAPDRRRRSRRRAGWLAASAMLLAGIVLFGVGYAKRHPTQWQSAMSWVTRGVQGAGAMKLAASTPTVEPLEQQPVAGLEGAPSAGEPAQRAVEAPAAPAVAEAPSDAIAARALERAPAVAEETSSHRERAQKAVLVRDWNAAVDAARQWNEQAPSRESRLFLARMLVHTRQCAAAVEVLGKDLQEQPRSHEIKALLGLCKVPAEGTQPAAPAPRPRTDKPRVARADQRG